MMKLEIIVAIVAPCIPRNFTPMIFITILAADPMIADLAIVFVSFCANRIGPIIPDAALIMHATSKNGTYCHAA